MFNTALSSDCSTNLYVYNQTEGRNVCDYQVTASFATVWGPYYDGRTILALKAPYTGGTASIRVQERNWMQAITLTHRVTVQKKLPTPSLSMGTLSLNRLFTERNATTVVRLDQCNLNIKDVTISSTARYGSSAAAEAQKINLIYDAKLNTICASIANPYDAPRNGTYSFRYVVTLDDEAETRLPARTFAVKIYSSAPSFKLSSSTLSLNRTLGSNAFAEATVVLAKGENCKLVDLRIPGSWDESDIRIAFDPETGRLSAELVNEGLANQKRIVYLTPVVRCVDTGEEVVLTANPIKITVQVYSGNPSVSLSAKGTLDTMVPNSAITYTVKCRNLTGKIGSVRLEGTNAQLFVANVDSTGRNVVLKIADGAQCSVRTTYKMKMVLTISGQEFSVGISFRVKQSALKFATVSKLQIAQSQTNSSWFNIALKSPSGATLESITLSNKSDATFLKLGQPYLRTTIAGDGCSAELRLNVINPGSLVRGKSYTVYLDVTPQNNASDVSPTCLRLTVKVS